MKITLNFILECLVTHDDLELRQIMAWRRTGDKLSPEPMTIKVARV